MSDTLCSWSRQFISFSQLFTPFRIIREDVLLTALKINHVIQIISEKKGLAKLGCIVFSLVSNFTVFGDMMGVYPSNISAYMYISSTPDKKGYQG